MTKTCVYGQKVHFTTTCHACFIPMLIRPSVLHVRHVSDSASYSIYFGLAMIATFILYVLIIKKLSNRVSQFDQGSQQGRQISKVRSSVARLLIATGTMFVLVYLPFYVNRFNRGLLTMTGNRVGYQMTPSTRGIVDWFTVCLLTMNSFINPVIYNLTNQWYRRAFIYVFTCKIFTMKTKNKSMLSHQAKIAWIPSPILWVAVHDMHAVVIMMWVMISR